MVGLDPIGGKYSQVVGVTDNGFVFGYSYDLGGVGHATVWRSLDTWP
jgi:hypothetical protein